MSIADRVVARPLQHLSEMTERLYCASFVSRQTQASRGKRTAGYRFDAEEVGVVVDLSKLGLGVDASEVAEEWFALYLCCVHGEQTSKSVASAHLVGVLCAFSTSCPTIEQTREDTPRYRAGPYYSPSSPDCARGP